jgi:hypothetical protein
MTTSRPQFRNRLLARALGASLDRQLAAGEPACARPAGAARAQYLASAAGRRQVIQGWNNLLRRARRPAERLPAARLPLPLCRERIIAAEPDVRYLLALLAGPRPVAPRGVAMAMALLTDGTSPVYNRHSPRSLTAATRDAIRQLDPAAARPLPAPGPAGRRPPY